MNLGLATSKRRAQDKSAWQKLVTTATSTTSSWRRSVQWGLGQGTRSWGIFENFYVKSNLTYFLTVSYGKMGEQNVPVTLSNNFVGGATAPSAPPFPASMRRRACHQPESESIADNAGSNGVKAVFADRSPRSIVLDFQSSFTAWRTSRQPDLWTTACSNPCTCTQRWGVYLI